MKINDDILDTLKEYRIQKDEGLLYLLAIYYNLSTSFFPQNTVLKVLSTNIFTTSDKGEVTWNTPLFQEQVTVFDWVKDYVRQFKNLNPTVPGSVAESTRRFKKFFNEYPQYTVEDVKNALNLYIKNLNDPKYIMWPHYFINKDGNSMLLTYIEEFKELSKVSEGRTSKSNTMQ